MIALYYLNGFIFNDMIFILYAGKKVFNCVNIGGSIEIIKYAAEVFRCNIGIAGTVASVYGAVLKL
jgi:hypothetical protein